MIESEGRPEMTQFNPQPAWISASTVETGERVRAFMKSVYAWMFGGLLLTTACGETKARFTARHAAPSDVTPQVNSSPALM